MPGRQDGPTVCVEWRIKYALKISLSLLFTQINYNHQKRRSVDYTDRVVDRRWLVFLRLNHLCQWLKVKLHGSFFPREGIARVGRAGEDPGEELVPWSVPLSQQS